jgi:hypothetical protein
MHILVSTRFRQMRFAASPYFASPVSAPTSTRAEANQPKDPAWPPGSFISCTGLCWAANFGHVLLRVAGIPRMSMNFCARSR